MQSNKAEQSQCDLLRVAYDKTMVTRSVASDLTLGDIGWTLCKNAKPIYGNPLAIDVILASRDADSASHISRILRPEARSAPGRNRLLQAAITAVDPGMPRWAL